MGFRELQRVKSAIQDAEHAELFGSELRPGWGCFELRVHTSVADDLADKAHNYILQTIGADAFPTEYIGLQRADEQQYNVYIGTEESFAAFDDIECVHVRDPVE